MKKVLIFLAITISLSLSGFYDSSHDQYITIDTELVNQKDIDREYKCLNNPELMKLFYQIDSNFTIQRQLENFGDTLWCYLGKRQMGDITIHLFLENKMFINPKIYGVTFKKKDYLYSRVYSENYSDAGYNSHSYSKIFNDSTFIFTEVKKIVDYDENTGKILKFEYDSSATFQRFKQ